jgi:hypothetical protein
MISLNSLPEHIKEKNAPATSFAGNRQEIRCASDRHQRDLPVKKVFDLSRDSSYEFPNTFCRVVHYVGYQIREDVNETPCVENEGLSRNSITVLPIRSRLLDENPL